MGMHTLVRGIQCLPHQVSFVACMSERILPQPVGNVGRSVSIAQTFAVVLQQQSLIKD